MYVQVAIIASHCVDSALMNNDQVTQRGSYFKCFLIYVYPCNAECFMFYTPTQFYTVNLHHFSYKNVFTCRVEKYVDPY